MKFKVISSVSSLPKKGKYMSFLITDSWDDWFEYSTMYSLWVFNEEGKRKNIGDIKIGQFSMKTGQRRANISKSFNTLNEKYFSLGQDESYYTNLKKLGDSLRIEVLEALNDIAYSKDIYKKAIKEKVTKVSLLRSVTLSTIKGQFRRLAHGGVRLSSFSFVYNGPSSKIVNVEAVKLSFEVIPEKNPPTNIHVLIGRNGVGKTYLINNMISSLLDQKASPSKVGEFISLDDNSDLFANVVSVTFSAFDESVPPKEQKDKSIGIQYSYVGLKRVKTAKKNSSAPKSPVMLKNEFVKSITICRATSRMHRWKRAIKMLRTDPMFKESNIYDIAKIKNDDKFKEKAEHIFKKLSSGHKIILLTLTRLVETVEEKSLVLLDEPEAHLHPPLLSAFIRSLSDLLIERNGVAVIATHSPVVLQEVPKSCVWKLRRNGLVANVDRLEIESFGENVGILTSEVFGLEVTHSGFHKLIKASVKKYKTYQKAIDSFDNQVGMEAKAILRGLFSNKDKVTKK